MNSRPDIRAPFIRELLLIGCLAATLIPNQARSQGLSVAAVNPTAGSIVTNLSQITVTFTKSVVGVQAEDLLLNGSSGTNVAGSGAVYTFTFGPPAPGAVEASWNGGHNISDLAGNRLDDLGANTLWEYTLLDKVPPSVTTIIPAPGSTVTHLTNIVVTFSEAVTGVDASDLLINGQPATHLSGSGAGPYTFGFSAPLAGTVQLSWLSSHGIHDLASLPNPFGGGTWNYSLHPGEYAGNVIINEFMAVNSSTNGLRDEDGALQDWVELFNRGNSTVNLNGWSLTDDPNQPEMWLFPPITLAPGRYLVVFASGKDRAPTNGNLHTNFKLGPGAQYLGLFNANFPRDVATQFLPAYPEQRANLAYGLYAGVFGYLTNATPGAVNSGPANFSGVASDPQASVSSGLFDHPFTLTLSTTTPGAAVRYTLDGSEPTATAGIIYTGALSVAGSPANAMINVRAIALRGDLLPSHVVTHSYLFPGYVSAQSTNPAGFPSAWLTQTNATSSSPTVVPADYEMDPRITTNSLYVAQLNQGVTNLPTLSIVADTDDLFAQTSGIYANPNPAMADRVLWERPASAELILPDGSAGFKMNAGLRIHGSTSRDPNWTRKHSLRLFFRSAYEGSLNYPVFNDSPAKNFKTLILSAGFNVSWNDRFEAGGAQSQFVRDQFCADLQSEMNRLSSHSRFVNLYLNGLYWGLFNLRERPDDDFAATYMGGDKSDYDVVRNSSGFFELVSGTTNAWMQMMALVNANLSNNSQYEQLGQYLDVDSFIDYMIMNQYAGNIDWANHNWYALRKRAPGAGYEFVSWDAEITLKSPTEDVTGYNQSGTPTMIHSFLRNNAEYRLKFADHVQKQFFNGGRLFVDTNQPVYDPENPQSNRPASLYMRRITEVAPAVVLESARWGDSVPARASNPFTVGDFLAELNRITNSYLPQRSGIVLNQYRSELLFPGTFGIAAPAFNQSGGPVPFGFNLTMTASAGTIYYTTNDSDPRVYESGTINSNALAYNGSPVILNRTTRVQARSFDGVKWSPLNDAIFSVAQLLPPLRIIEIMYQPAGGDTYQFLELQNLGPTTLDLSGWAISGISFIFPAGSSIGPGAVLVLASVNNPVAFVARYPGLVVAGYFAGKLAAAGERIAVKDATGNPVVTVNYSNSGGWPVVSEGHSIEIIDPYGDPDDPANWRASTVNDGTPGTISSPPPLGFVRLNEVMALNSIVLTNAGTTPDWIELINTGANPADLSDWSLSNDGNPRKFVFPSGTAIPPAGFLLVFCDSQTNAPGLHTGFALSGQGEHVFLYDAQMNRADALGFGPQVPNLSLGRVGSEWQLTIPTPNAANQLANVGSPSNLVLNEWLANSASGQPDWLELYNPSSLPVPLRGLHLGITNALFQISAISFLPPGGYVQLFADQSPGPNHLNFKLPAAGGILVLYDSSGTELDQISYGPQLDGISQGRLPDGTANVVRFPGSASPGTTNFVLSFNGPVLNEIMARNERVVVDPWGGTSDWLEIRNLAAVSFDLSGMSMSLDQAQSGQWKFPVGTTLAPDGYLIVWCNSSRPASTNLTTNLNLGHSLNGTGGAVYLFNPAGQVVDYVEYGFQLSDQSIGRSGGAWQLLAAPTLGAANAPAAPLGDISNLRFNEWMAQPQSGDPWLELYSSDDLPVNLSGLFLSNDPSLPGRTKFTIPPLTFIAGRSCVLWDADGHPSRGRDHLNFTLQTWGQSLRLYAPDLSLIDAVDFGAQQPGVSQGRLPDGGNTISSFLLTPTPGEPNYLPLTNVVINEVLSHADPPLEDAIELANMTSASIDIGGWYLSDQPGSPQKFRIPDGTLIPANGFAVFYQYQFDPNPGVNPSFALDSAHGDTVCLSAADAAGNLTGYRTSVRFGAAENPVSFGRYTNSTGVEFVALSRRTFGADNPLTLADFRAGAGLPNADPKVGPVVINEIMYRPATLANNALADSDQEFVELYNLSTNAVSLFHPAFPTNTWRLGGGINFVFPTGAVLAPQSHLLILHFDPLTDSATLAAFRSRFGVKSNVPVYGPFSARLSNEGGTVRLYKPDAPSLPPAPDAGFVPWILVDQVDYLPGAPWPPAIGTSLQRRVPAAYGNDPLNWKADVPTAGRANIRIGPAPPAQVRPLGK